MNSLFDISKEIIVLTGVNGILGIEYAHYLLKQNATVIGLDINKNENFYYFINYGGNGIDKLLDENLLISEFIISL